MQRRDMPVRVGRSALRLQQAVRGYQFSNRISRCSDRFYAACMYYRASICTSFRTDAFQETDVINVTMPVTKWNYQVTDATQLPAVLAKAFSLRVPEGQALC